MRKFTTAIVALTVSAAAVTAFASPSFAQKRNLVNRIPAPQTELQAPQVSHDGVGIPGYVLHANSHMSDEGYGRYSFGDN